MRTVVALEPPEERNSAEGIMMMQDHRTKGRIT
jgi:hypothetical protein